MARTNFEKLRVYQLSEEMADEIWKMVLDWNILAQDTVGKQMIRAADSIPANIAEGSGKGTQKESSFDTRESPEVHYTKRRTGFAEPIFESS